MIPVINTYRYLKLANIWGAGDENLLTCSGLTGDKQIHYMREKNQGNATHTSRGIICCRKNSRNRWGEKPTSWRRTLCRRCIRLKRTAQAVLDVGIWNQNLSTDIDDYFSKGRGAFKSTSTKFTRTAVWLSVPILIAMSGTKGSRDIALNLFGSHRETVFSSAAHCFAYLSRKNIRFQHVDLVKW